MCECVPISSAKEGDAASVRSVNEIRIDALRFTAIFLLKLNTGFSLNGIHNDTEHLGASRSD
jgi:hypothetical protein